MIGSLGESLVLFFLFFRLVLGVVATLARFFPKAVVKVVEVADIPMVVVVVALGGSMGTSASERGERSGWTVRHKTKGQKNRQKQKDYL